jgi:hypothetical protein
MRIPITIPAFSSPLIGFLIGIGFLVEPSNGAPIDNDEDTDNDTGIHLSGSSVSWSVSVSWSNDPQTCGH